jgi:hypothetical protein
VLRARLEALVNVEQQLTLIHHEKVWRNAPALPVPLGRWARLPAEARERYLKDVNTVLAWSAKPPVQLPQLPQLPGFVGLAGRRTSEIDIDETTFARYTEVIVGSYDKLRRLTIFEDEPGVPSVLQPEHIAEASAVLVQLQELWRALGADAVYAFHDRLSALRTVPHLSC